MIYRMEMPHRLVVAAVSLVLLSTLIHNSESVGATRRRERLEQLHPTAVLTGSSPGGGRVPGGHHQPFLHQQHQQRQQGKGPVAANAGSGGGAQEERTLREELLERLAAQGTDTQKASVRFILELYERLEKGERLTLPPSSSAEGKEGIAPIASADTIRGLTPTVSKRYSSHPELTLNFPLSGVTGYNEGTELAELRIRPQARHPSKDGRQKDVSGRSPTRLARRAGLQRVRVRVVDAAGGRQVARVYRVTWRRDARDGYTVLDITRVLRDMAAAGVERYQNGSLEIALRKTRRPHRLSSSSRRRPRSVRQTLWKSSRNQPFKKHMAVADDILLVVYAKSQGHFLDDEFPLLHNASILTRARLKKTSNLNDRTNRVESRRFRRKATVINKKKQRCAAEDMHVDFNTLGWADDIVFPVRFNARTCSGRCPSPVDHTLHPTNHAILQSMMRMHDRLTQRPCCVPVTLRPLMMLYHRDRDRLRSNGDIEIRTHPDMIVDECGCR